MDNVAELFLLWKDENAKYIEPYGLLALAGAGICKWHIGFYAALAH